MKDYIATKKTHIAEMPTKQLWLAGIFNVASVAMWFFLFRSFVGGTLGSQIIIYAIAAGMVWIVLFSLTLLFLNKTLALFSYAVLFVVLLIFFGLRGFTILGLIIFMVAVLWAYQKANNERRLLLEFKTFRILKRALPIFFTGLALFLAFAYNDLALGDILEDDLTVPPEVYGIFFQPAEAGLRILLPNYESGMSIGKFQEVILKSPIALNIFETVGRSPQPGDILISDKIASQSLQDFSLRWVNNNIQGILEPYRGFLPFVFIFGLFFVFKTFSLPLMWVSFGISWVVVKILLSYNVVTQKDTGTIKKEVVLN